jgi:aldehyde dehydrogenase (NAD+)
MGKFSCSYRRESNMAIDSAHNALYQGPWADYTATERGKLIYKLGDLISEHASELGDLETRDSGKLLVETRSQSRYVADYYYYYAGLADKIQGEVLPIDKPNMRVFTCIGDMIILDFTLALAMPGSTLM